MPLSARRASSRDSRDDGAGAFRSRSVKGTAYMNVTRRRGRAAHQRSPDDSPLRDGNRDRLIGLLTLRAAKTLEYYFMETNLTYHHWLSAYIRQHPIPLEGNWDDVSGEAFLRTLLTQGVNETKYAGGVKDPLFSCVGSIGIDPRAIGQRIMDIRSALAQEFIQDLSAVAEENAILMRECAMMSLEALDSISDEDEREASGATLHPEMMDGSVSIPDSSSEFLANMTKTAIERFQQRQEAMRDEAGSSGGAEDAAPPADEIRPGLDDINEFESELEAPDKWKRRFRLLKGLDKDGRSSREGSSSSSPPPPEGQQEGHGAPEAQGEQDSHDADGDSTSGKEGGDSPGR